MSQEKNFLDLQEAIVAGNAPKMVKGFIDHAVGLRASDLHVEPEERNVRVRYRVDGVLRHIIEYPRNLHPTIVSRIKIMAGLRIDEQRLPQGGSAKTIVKREKKEEEVDLRISTLPNINGEKIAIRIQERLEKIPSFSRLGLIGHNLDKVEKAIKEPNGVLLVTGPTGSGKTTTLYSAMQELNKEKINITTIEDPV
ncbi:MAG TPA: general secretion pathway protein GspE, partial [Candidatus Peregrinibacteria bacterium]|nr:general secretion pathway protein GspE [Candidatus Peregrinibacteria bacterium]